MDFLLLSGTLRSPGACPAAPTDCSVASALVVDEADACRGGLRSDVVPRAGAPDSVLLGLRMQFGTNEAGQYQDVRYELTWNAVRSSKNRGTMFSPWAVSSLIMIMWERISSKI